MGLLFKGEWRDEWYNTEETNGEFVREAAKLRNWITETGDAGPSGKPGFKAETDRYHLYVSLACPWAHRTLIFRKIKQLNDLISVSIVSPDMLSKGWTFDEQANSSGDHLYQSQNLSDIYLRNDADYSGRVTVPILWDKQTHSIVSNESSEIIRMFNTTFNRLTGNMDDYYPEHLRQHIDTINDRIYEDINNGVYRCGFATSQSAYENAYERLFRALDWVEEILAKQAFIAGDVITEADWRLFTTLIRFDSVYFGHFKCNKRMLEDYDNISNYIRQLYQWPGVAETVNMEHIKRHYYYSHTMINPTQVVPAGPEINYRSSHNRG